MADDDVTTDGSVRTKLVVGIIGLAFVAAGILVKTEVSGLLQDPVARVTKMTLSSSTRGEFLHAVGITPTDDDRRGAREPGVRVDAKLRIRQHDRVEVLCTLTASGMPPVVERIEWVSGDPEVVPCWLVKVDQHERGMQVMVQLFEPGERRNALDSAGPRSAEAF